MAIFYSFMQSAMETPIKMVEKGYCFENISADVQVSDHVVEVGYTLLFPFLTGLPA